ncbi:MAG: N-formylglutamate amidohydrolase [Pseudomonadota bacterium]
MPTLLGEQEPEPFDLYNGDAGGAFLLTGDHAGNRIPSALDGLGLPPSELNRHIGIDIGIARLGPMLADRLDAAFVSQPYSRLVIDCNRPPHQLDAIPEVSDGTTVPGNVGLGIGDRRARISEIFDFYHARVRLELERRHQRGQRTVFVALHSFTPHHGDFPAPRPWHIGVLWNRDGRLARPLLERLRKVNDVVVGENQPYGVSDELDYAIPVYGEAQGILSVELEVRQDLLYGEDDCAEWADRIAPALSMALKDHDAAAPTEVVK